jgi:hypothetical protein
MDEGIRSGVLTLKDGLLESVEGQVAARISTFGPWGEGARSGRLATEPQTLVEPLQLHQ